MFIHFNPDSGDILSITNVLPEFDYIEVDIADVELIHTGKESVHKYTVKFDEEKKAYQLQKKNVINVFQKTINDIVYEIPKINIRNGITVIQDVQNECWKFLISEQLEAELKTTNSYTDYEIYFSVTEYGNPNVLYKQLTINLEQLVKNHYQIIPFSMNFETTNLPISLFTNKIFEYNYERFSV